jgi:microcystin-dependent protein
VADLQPKVEQIEGLASALAITSEVRWIAHGGAPPAGWLPCDGSVVSQAAYPDLYAALGTTWGPDGGGNFTLPDLRGKSPVGSGTGAGLSPRAVGAVGGEEQHQLAIAEMPSHNHPGSSVSGSLQTYSGIGATGPASDLGLNPAGAYPVGGTANVQLQGGNGFHNTMHPFAVLQPIIKT